MDQNIFQQLNIIFKKKQPVRLLNVYQGVPISYDAMIVGTTANSVKMIIHKYQSVCLRLHKYTYFISPLLPGVIKASALAVDLATNIAILFDFQYSDDGIGKRMLVRAKPTEPIDVLLMNDTKTQRIKIQLMDISLTGMAVSAPQLLFNVEVFKQNSTVYAQFNLPGDAQGKFIPVNVTGTIVNINLDKSKQVYRIGLRIFPDEIAHPILVQYISRRQSEIMKDIRTLYNKMLEAEASKGAAA
jgi:c-di-GMP-binding flagellar brake protein YcgR